MIEFASVGAHSNRQDCWVIINGSVYDLTDFTGHPGGYGRIQMASGHDLEPFWQVYKQHNRGHVADLLQKYRVGHLAPRDAATVRQRTRFDNPYSNDPPPKVRGAVIF